MLADLVKETVHFECLARSLDVQEALAQIKAQPELWGQNPERTAAPSSPHAQSRDIWIRFRARHELVRPEQYSEPHFAEFYPAWHALPALRPLVFGIMAKVEAVYLGGIMLTRLPAGSEILPHVDGGWHADYMNTKAYVILQANDACVNYCGSESVVMHAGEAWRFDNDVVHSVVNGGDADRIAMILTCRCE